MFPLCAHAAPAPPSPAGFFSAALPKNQIRILLGNFVSPTITGTDLVVDGNLRIEGASTFSLRCESDNRGETQISYGKNIKTGGTLEISSPGGFLQVNNKTFRNKIFVSVKGTECQVVNWVDIEKYLAGLLNKEMSPSWPMEALKAQAVASRSYAIAKAMANRNRSYDMESTTEDQVYAGSSSETAKSHRAVEETRGMVLWFSQSPLTAYFHSNCGGMTEAPAAVWGGNVPALQPVVCPYHRKNRDKIFWKVSLSKQQVARALSKIDGLIPNGLFRLAHLEAGAPTPNQRLNDVVISDTENNNLIVSANTFRNAIGSQKVRSTSFSIAEENGKYQITGRGFGHGVGMCQMGARAMAEEGKTFKQILKHYYPLVKMKRWNLLSQSGNPRLNL